MDIFNLFYMTIMIIGGGLFSGFIFPCLDGPLDILKILRGQVGKPFTCPLCSFFWTVIFGGLLIYYVPIVCYTIAGSLGWGVLVLHISGYQVFYPGMEDE